MNTSPSGQNKNQAQQNDLAHQQGLKPAGSTASSEQISSRARQLWQQAGSPEGRDLEFWLAAENELTTHGNQQASRNVSRNIEVEAGTEGADEASNNEGDRETRSSQRQAVNRDQRAGRREGGNFDPNQQAEAEIVDLKQTGRDKQGSFSRESQKPERRENTPRQSSDSRRNG
jgi:hypothetical protein